MALAQVTSKEDHRSLPLTNFREMSAAEREHYAKILCCQPEPRISYSSEWWQQYRHQTQKQIKALPAHLREHPNWLNRYLNKHIEDETRGKLRYLCSLHDQMSRSLVRSLFHWIRKEIDVCIPSVISPLVETGLLSTDVIQVFTRMSNVAAMWIAPNDFKHFYERKVDPKWEKQNDGCAACMIARLASDPNILLGLKAGMLIRAKSNEITESSRRMHYVNCMIDKLPCDDTENVKEDALALGRSLQIMLKKWKTRQGLSSTPVTPVGELKSLNPQNNLSISKPQSSPLLISSDPKDSKNESVGEYEPIPWRVDLAKANIRHDTIDDLIEQYREATLESSPGRSDYFKSYEHDEDEGEETFYSLALPSRASYSVYSEGVQSKLPEILASGAADIRSVKGSLRRTDSLRQLPSSIARKGVMTMAREYQELIGQNPVLDPSGPSLPPPSLARKSSASCYSRGSSQIEGSFYWDKFNFSEEDVITSKRTTQWSSFVDSSSLSTVHDV